MPGRGTLVRRSVRRHRCRLGSLRGLVPSKAPSRRIDLVVIGMWANGRAGARAVVARARAGATQALGAGGRCASRVAPLRTALRSGVSATWRRAERSKCRHPLGRPRIWGRDGAVTTPGLRSGNGLHNITCTRKQTTITTTTVKTRLHSTRRRAREQKSANGPHISRFR